MTGLHNKIITILIAEDEKMVRSVLVNLIPWKSLGVDKVFEVTNGLEALQAAKAIHPDIILSDIRMPKMTGIDFAAKYKEIDPDCRLIFLSAYTDKEYYKSAIHLRVVGYIEKPVQPDEVIRVVSIAVSEIRASRKNSPDIPYVDGEPALGGAAEDFASLSLAGKAVQCVENNYMNEALNIEFIASELYLSPNYLSAIFKKEMGVTVNQFITNVRLKHSRELLADRTMQLKDIALQVGYQDSNYFAKVFKAKTGMTPTEYRRTLP